MWLYVLSFNHDLFITLNKMFRVLAVLAFKQTMKISSSTQVEFTEILNVLLTALIMVCSLLVMVMTMEINIGWWRIVGERVGEIMVISRLPEMKITCVVLLLMPAIQLYNFFKSEHFLDLFDSFVILPLYLIFLLIC